MLKGLKSNLGAPYSFDIGGNEEALKVNVDGVGFWAIGAIFGGRAFFLKYVPSVADTDGSVDLRKLLGGMSSSRGGHGRPSVSSSGSYGKGGLRAALLGAKVCQQVVDQFTADGFAADGTLGYRGDPTKFKSINKPQKLAGITDFDNTRDR